MEVSDLGGTYRRYKTNTNDFVQWLSVTAQGTSKGDQILRGLEVSSNTASSRRLKGEAKEEENEESKEATQTPPATLAFQVPVRLYKQLADIIAQDEQMEVPKSIFTNLRAVIRDRKTCSKWYSANTKANDSTVKQNNYSHEYFINVLESILDVLHPKEPQMQKSFKSRATIAQNEVKNRYVHLELEETEDTVDMPTVYAPSEKSSVDCELETLDGEAMFAIYCLLMDITKVRVFVAHTWREFKNGGSGLCAASLTMETAIAMVQRLCNDFGDNFPQFTTSMHDAINEYLRTVLCTTEHGREFPVAQTERMGVCTSDNEHQILHADSILCIHTSTVLQIFDKQGAQKLSPNLHKFSQLSVAEKLLAKCILQIGVLPPTSTSGLVHKAVTTLLEGNIETWAIVAVEMLWDTQQELGTMLNAGQMVLSSGTRDLMGRYEAYRGAKGLENVREMMSKSRKRVEEVLTSLRERPLLTEKYKLVVNETVGESVVKSLDMVDFSLFENHPQRCGLELHDLRIQYHQFFTDLANSNAQILAVMHLYNAARQTGKLSDDVQWGDLNFFMKRQDLKWLFVGENKPTVAQDMSKRLWLALGYPLARFAQNQRQIKGGGRGPTKTNTPIRAVQYIVQYLHFCFDLDGFRRPFRESRAQHDPVVMAHALAKDLFRSKATPKDFVGLLQTQKDALSKDEFACNFDVMDLHVRCVRLLSTIQHHCMDNAPSVYPRSNYNNPHQQTVECLLDMLKFLARAPASDPSMFTEAVKILEQVIKEEGDVVMRSTVARAQTIKVKPQTPTDNETTTDSSQGQSLEEIAKIMNLNEGGSCAMS